MLSPMEYGVRPFLIDVVSIALRLTPTRDDLFSGLKSLTPIALHCDPKLSPAGQTAKHDGLYPLLSVSLTVPPFVERFQQCDNPCRVVFYALFHESYIFRAFKRT